MFKHTPTMKNSLVVTIIAMGVIAMVLSMATGKIYRELAFHDQRAALVELIQLEVDEHLEKLQENLRDLGLSVQQDIQFQKAMDADDWKRVVSRLDSRFHQYYVTAGVVKLDKLYVYDLDFNLLAMSSEGIKTQDIICNRLPVRANQRRGAKRLSIIDELCTHQGRVYFAVMVPVGGLRPKGYIQVLADPVHVLSAVEQLLGFKIQAYTHAHTNTSAHTHIQTHSPDAAAVVYQSKQWPQVDALKTSLIAEYALPTTEGKTALHIRIVRDMKQYFEQLDKKGNQVILLAGVITFLASLLALYALRKTTLTPMMLLQGQLRRIRRDRRSLGETIAVGGSPELRELAEGFNEMTRELRDVHDDLERRVDKRTASLKISNEKLMQEINIRRKTEQALIFARDRAEQADHAKSQFLSHMSHELRTPLNAILGFAQIMEADMGEQEIKLYGESLDHIKHSGWHLLEMVNEVLDLSRIENGKLELKDEVVNLNEQVAEAVNMTLSQISDKELQISNRLASAEPIFVHADRLRLKQVLLNLMSNAVKYNREGGSVSVFCTEQPNDRLRISIKDTGPGIEQSQQNKLFKPFSRLDADDKCIEGTGIGLVVSKSFVELMGGTIGVDSEAGKGSTFWFELRQEKSTNKLESDIIDAGQLRTSERQAGKFTVLYIEDNQTNLQLVEGFLKSQRPEVRLIGADSAERGIEIAQAEQPDVILMDINLPGMNGMEACLVLKQNIETRDIPVLAVSADAMSKDIDKALASGFTEYITKPIDFKQFLVVLDAVIADRNSETEHQDNAIKAGRS